MPDAAMPTNRCMSQAAMATRMRIVTRAATTSLAVVRRGSDCPSPSRRCRGAVSPSVPDGSARCRSIPCGLRPHGSITSPHKTGSRDDGCVRLVETVVCSDEPGGEHWWPRGCLAGAGDPQPEACSVVAMLLCCYVVMLFSCGFCALSGPCQSEKSGETPSKCRGGRMAAPNHLPSPLTPSRIPCQHGRTAQSSLH